MTTRLTEKENEYHMRSGSGLFTERARAEAEAEMWALVPLEDRPRDGQGRSHWLAARLGGVRLHYEHRYTLLAMGDVVADFWPRVEADMALATAMQLLRTAKKVVPGATGDKLREAIREVLREYDARPQFSRTARGKVVKKRTARTLPSPFAEQKRDSRGASFWTTLRPILAAYVAERLVGVDPMTTDRIYREFERDVNVLCDEYQTKIDAARRKGTMVVTVSRRQVIDACAVLALDPPAPGGSVDLVVARRQQRRQARLYHPDAHGGDTSTRVQYERVMQAYLTLEQYQTKNRSTDDGAARGDHHDS